MILLFLDEPPGGNGLDYCFLQLCRESVGPLAVDEVGSMGAVPPEVTPAQGFVSWTRRHQLMGLLPWWASPESIRWYRIDSFIQPGWHRPHPDVSQVPVPISSLSFPSFSVLSSLLCFPWTCLPAQGLVWGVTHRRRL